jgi:acyl-CoA thioesterase-1
MRKKNSVNVARRHLLTHCSALAASCVLWGGMTTLPCQAQTDQPQSRRILVVGDSISAEYGLTRGTGWVPLLQSKLTAHNFPVQVINASISGDTTAGGRSRLPALLARHQPALVILELGGNDALRGLDLRMSENNLEAMTEAAQRSGAQVLLLGMQVPPNYGNAYSLDFIQMFVRVAKKKKTALVPFLLKSVADTPNAAQLFQADRIHPNEAAQEQMLDNVWPHLLPLLK